MARKNGYHYGFAKGDLVQWPDNTIGVVISGLCRPVAYVEAWTTKDLHIRRGKSLREARKISLRDFVTSSWFDKEAFEPLAQEILWRYLRND